MQTSCRDVERFSSGSFDAESIVFGVPKSDWTDFMYNFVRSVAYDCGANLKSDFRARNALTDGVVEKISEMYDATNVRVLKISKENAEQKKSASMAEEKKKGDERMAASALSKRIEQCKSSRRYELYEAQRDVVVSLDEISSYNESMAYERRVAAASGVRNLVVERRIGEGIIASRDNLKIGWSGYKALGGKASSPQKIPRNLIDPCEEIQ